MNQILIFSFMLGIIFESWNMDVVYVHIHKTSYLSHPEARPELKKKLSNASDFSLWRKFHRSGRILVKNIFLSGLQKYVFLNLII